MRPKIITNHQENLFKDRLSNQLNLKHELIALSKLIPWDSLEEEFADICPGDGNAGRPATPVRLIVGLLLLQYLHNLSDENVVRMWVENPYWQYFCGYDYLQWELPINPSSLTRWRKRLGAENCKKILGMSVSVAVNAGVVSKKDLETVIVDTTVMPKNIEHPTDSKLLEKARCKMVKLAQENGLKLRQNYNLVAKKSLRKIGGYLHAQQMKRAKKEIKHFKTLVGRVTRDCERQVAGNARLEGVFSKILQHSNHLLKRERNDKNKLYSLHEPDVVCISKGKAHKKYEFGAKLSIGVTHRKGPGIIVTADALEGNPYDGHTLKGTLLSAELVTGIKVIKGFVDLGYKGHGVETEDCKIYMSRQKRGVTKAIKQQINRRQAIEPHIGHLKNEGKMGLCRLKGFLGDKINALLCAASYNLKQVLNHLRVLYAQILWFIFFISMPQKITADNKI